MRRGESRLLLVCVADALSCVQVAGLAGVRPIGLVPKRRTCLLFDCPEEHKEYALVP